MTDLQDLYQEIVMDHNWTPRNFPKMETPPCSSHGFNPFCGDTITVYASIAEEIITDVSFEAAGCSISKASASMMTEAVKGLTITDAKTVFSKFHELVTQTGNAYEDDASLGDLVVLAGVRAFPTRIKCAPLSWHALKGALEDEDQVSTE